MPAARRIDYLVAFAVRLVVGLVPPADWFAGVGWQLVVRLVPLFAFVQRSY